MVWWLVFRITRRQTEVCFWPCGLLGSKYQLTNFDKIKCHLRFRRSVPRRYWYLCTLAATWAQRVNNLRIADSCRHASKEAGVSPTEAEPLLETQKGDDGLFTVRGYLSTCKRGDGKARCSRLTASSCPFYRLSSSPLGGLAECNGYCRGLHTNYHSKHRHLRLRWGRSKLSGWVS